MVSMTTRMGTAADGESPGDDEEAIGEDEPRADNGEEEVEDIDREEGYAPL